MNFEWCCIEQLSQTGGGMAAENCFVIAAGRMGLGGIDVGDANLHAVQPDCIAIDNAIGTVSQMTEPEISFDCRLLS